VPTTLSVVAESDHGFLMMADSVASAEKELQRIFEWLRDMKQA
jgi:hypothetical protein